MDYKQSLDFIHAQNKFGTKLGLENVRALTASLGYPQKKLSFIHIAGTNGKGSISTMLSYALSENGYKTGLFISPYVVRFNERIQLNNAYIPNDRLADITTRIKAQIDKNIRQGIAHPTEFELVTAIALVYFAEEGADLVVWETGLGGRLDATNLIEKNLCSAISSISYDHTEYLGETLEEIAYEKSCIIKEQCPCILMQQDPLVHEVIAQRAAVLQSPLFIANTNDIKAITQTPTGQTLRLYDDQTIHFPLSGSYQIKNLAVVLKVLDVINANGFSIDFQRAYRGIEKVAFPGRFEALHTFPLIILDAAHNEEGIRVLNDNIEKLFFDREVTLFLGKLRDKDFGDELRRLIKNKKRVYTLTPPNPRALTAIELSNQLKEAYDIDAAPIEISDITQYIDKRSVHDVYLFAGSIYLISTLRDILIHAAKNSE